MFFSRLLLACTAVLTLAEAKTVKKTLRVTYGQGAPDGITRDMIFINDQFPGPDLVFDEGDDVVVSLVSITTKFATR